MIETIIYTGATGGGHILAATSLKNALERNGDKAKLLDAFKEGGVFVNKAVTDGYKQLVEYLPKLYKKLYDRFDEENLMSDVVMKNGMRLIRKDILNDILKYDPDLIISAHPIVTNILGRIKDKGTFQKPILAIVTDYKVHEMYIRPSIDAYVVGSDYTKQTMIDRGVPAEKIYPYGIPIRKEFREHRPEEHIKGTIMLMAGSLGSRQLKKAFQALLKVKAPLRLIVVCGHNDAMRHSLLRETYTLKDDDKQIEILGFVNNISELMDESDAIITKPGGLTSTEAISKNIPMIIPYTYPGQEEDNARYLVQNGMALKTNDISDLTELVEYLIENRSVVAEMRRNMSRQAAKFSIDKTVALCHELVENRKQAF